MSIMRRVCIALQILYGDFELGHVVFRRLLGSLGWWFGIHTVIDIYICASVSMRMVFVLVLVAFALAYVLPTESLDTFYWAQPVAVNVVGLDGRTLWSQQAVYPLIATDRAGRCLAIANRPYIYDMQIWRESLTISSLAGITLAPELVEALRQYGVRLPQTINVWLNFTLPLPPLVLASVYKTTVVSLHAPYGYPHWAVNLGPRANVTAVATNCEYVVAATVFGEVYVVRDGRIVGNFLLDPRGVVRRAPDVDVLDPPVTAVTIINRTVYVGTSTGDIYRFVLPTEEEFRSGRFDWQLRRLDNCGGAVYGLYVDARGGPVALCFVKRERPYAYVYPYGIWISDAVLATYGIDTPRLVSAMSQDGWWLFLGAGNDVIAIRDGRFAWRYTLPAKPSAVATSWNGSVVAVGTQAGHFYVLRNGVPVIRTDPISTLLLLRAVGGNATGNFTLAETLRQLRPVTSVAVSFDGQTAAFEMWDSLQILYTARVPYVVDAPGECLPLEAAVTSGNVAYIYQLGRSGALYVPYGRVSVYPLYRYVGDFRCRPLQNFTLTIFGDLTEPLVFRFVKEFRVARQPADLVRGPDWAFGQARFSAEPMPKVSVQVVVQGDERAARLAEAARGQVAARFVGWVVDGRQIGLFPVVAVDVRGPAEVRAVYEVSAPELVSEGDVGIKLRNVVVYDLQGNVVDAGMRPRFDVYPVNVVAYYVPAYRVSAGGVGATVNGSDVVWAELGSVVEFVAREVVDLGNGTRLVFAGWAETGERSPVVRAEVRGPMRLTAVHRRQYAVYVRPPARVGGAVGNFTWVDAGSKIRVEIPPVLSEQAGVRTAFKNWVINGVSNATLNAPAVELTVRRPLNITYETKRQYLVSFTSRYGSAPPSMWVDEGKTVAAVPTPTDVWAPPPLRWTFAGWRDVATGVVYSYPAMPVVTGPATYEAVWSLDPIPLVAIAGGIAAAVFLVWFIRKRRLQRLMAEVVE